MALGLVAMKSRMTRASRNRQRTRQRILGAVGKLLASGFRDVGINAVAREARVDKVLIYRYFGGMPQLLLAYAQEGDFWPTADELLARFQGKLPNDGAQLASTLLTEFARALRRRPVTQEIMRWSLLEQNELTDALARYREQQGLRWFAMVPELPGLDIRVLGSVLGAGLTYLTLRSKTATVYNGLELRDPRVWTRIETCVDSLVHLAFQAHADERKPRASKSSASSGRSLRRQQTATVSRRSRAVSAGASKMLRKRKSAPA